MGHFVYCKPIAIAGDWTSVVVPANAWFTTMDQQLYKAINGDDGGTWAPAIPITIGGAGVAITGVLSVTGAATFDQLEVNDLIVDSTVTLDGAAGTVQGAGSLDFTTGSTATWQTGTTAHFANGATLDMVAGSQMTGTLKVVSGASVDFKSGSGLIVEAGTTVTLNADATLQGKITKIGSNAQIIPRVLTLTDADGNGSVANDSINAFITTATSRALTLLIASAPTPVAGQCIDIRFMRTGGGTGSLTIQNEGSAANILTCNATTVGCRVMFDGTKWRLLANYQGTPGADA